MTKYPKNPDGIGPEEAKMERELSLRQQASDFLKSVLRGGVKADLGLGDHSSGYETFQGLGQKGLPLSEKDKHDLSGMNDPEMGAGSYGRKPYVGPEGE